MRAVWVLFVLTVGACRSPVVISGPLVFERTPVAITLSAPVSAPGPTHEFCFTPLLEGVAPEADGRLWIPGRHDFVRVRVVMVMPTGQRDTLHRPGAWDYEAGEICLWTHMEKDEHRQYARFEVTADTTLHVTQVRWWSGERIASL